MTGATVFGAGIGLLVKGDTVHIWVGSVLVLGVLAMSVLLIVLAIRYERQKTRTQWRRFIVDDLRDIGITLAGNLGEDRTILIPLADALRTGLEARRRKDHGVEPEYRDLIQEVAEIWQRLGAPKG